MTRKRSIQIYSLCIISMVVLGALSDRALAAWTAYAEKILLECDPHAFATGKTETFSGWAYGL